jgi:hypothetical protein
MVVSENKKVLHLIFKTKCFRDDLAEFLSTKPNMDLRPSCVWNVCLFYNQISQIIYRPAVNSFFGFFTEDLSILHQNICSFISKNLIDREIDFERTLHVSGIFTKGELASLNKKDHKIGITGRYDILDKTGLCLHEIKTSTLDRCSQEWVIQGLGYILLLNIISLLGDYLLLIY